MQESVGGRTVVLGKLQFWELKVLLTLFALTEHKRLCNYAFKILDSCLGIYYIQTWL